MWLCVLPMHVLLLILARVAPARALPLTCRQCGQWIADTEDEIAANLASAYGTYRYKHQHGDASVTLHGLTNPTHRTFEVRASGPLFVCLVL